jgi:hypothetical protein
VSVDIASGNYVYEKSNGFLFVIIINSCCSYREDHQSLIIKELNNSSRFLICRFSTMSSRDSWIKFHQWWQEHLKFHFVSSSSISDDHLTSRRSSLISYRSTKNSQLIKIKKRSSCGGIDERQLGHNDFRHVRDSIRGKNPRTTRITSTITTNKRSVSQKRIK